MLVGVGAGLMLFGFLAALAFQRWHVPDFLLLMLLGIAIGPGGFGLVGPRSAEAIDTVAGPFMAVAVAFILFEGGVRLPLRGMGGPFVLIVAHAVLVMGATVAATWWIGTRHFGLSGVGSLLFGAATIGPSASIIVSVAPRLRLEHRVQWAIVLESVLANVLAAAVVVALVQINAVEGGMSGTAVVLQTLAAVALALFVGVGWLQVVRRLETKTFLYMATLGIVLALYAVSTGFLGGSGTLAAFVFGVVMGNRRVFDPSSWGKEGFTGHVPWDDDLGRFHEEVTFFIRTFFFLYLGFLFEVQGGFRGPLLFAVALALVYFLARWPSTALLARVWRLPKRERRMMNVALARGLTDAVLVLYGVEVGLVAAAEGRFLTDAILVLLLVTAIATGALIMLTERLAARRAEPEGERVPFTPELDLPGRARE